jgi:hypothetical protein
LFVLCFSAPPCAPPQRAEIEQVIRRDHQHFNGSKR